VRVACAHNWLTVIEMHSIRTKSFLMCVSV
jgi:hypothetical protein